MGGAISYIKKILRGATCPLCHNNTIDGMCSNCQLLSVDDDSWICFGGSECVDEHYDEHDEYEMQYIVQSRVLDNTGDVKIMSISQFLDS
jgi:hypothetical protein